MTFNNKLILLSLFKFAGRDAVAHMSGSNRLLKKT